jgi:hypothetical protein
MFDRIMSVIILGPFIAGALSAFLAPPDARWGTVVFWLAMAWLLGVMAALVIYLLLMGWHAVTYPQPMPQPSPRPTTALTAVRRVVSVHKVPEGERLRLEVTEADTALLDAIREDKRERMGVRR